MEKKDIEIPFGACDSELDGFEYTIPEGYEAEIRDGKIVVRKIESEDEKMIQYFKDLAPFDKADELYEKYGFSHKDAIAWLEKQGGHAKFINGIQVGDKVTRNEDGVLINLSQLKRVAKRDEKQGEQKPAWSEEDKVMLDKVIERLHKHSAGDKEYLDIYYWLIALKDRVQPQPKQEWKPSDEQMGALRSVVTELKHSDNKYQETIEDLYQDLKKLMEK